VSSRGTTSLFEKKPQKTFDYLVSACGTLGVTDSRPQRVKANESGHPPLYPAARGIPAALNGDRRVLKTTDIFGRLVNQMRVEILDGPGSKTAVQTLFTRVYPAKILATMAWRNVVSAPADRRVVLIDHAGDIIAAAGLIFRTGSQDGGAVRIGGIGGVMVSPERQRQGLGRTIMQAADEELRSDPKLQFGLLFCEPHNTVFYEAMGWSRFGGDIRVEQPGGSIVYDIMQGMTLPLAAGAPRSATIDLRGLPW
jgi:GNAT superfamily N-acetyltransferase